VTSTRRAFLATSLKAGAFAGAGLAIWIELPRRALAQTPNVFEPNAYISITPDNVVRLWVTRSEMGQGVRTALPMMLPEELEGDWTSIHFERAIPGDDSRASACEPTEAAAPKGPTTLRKAA
jgi:isoquinoline 1-oxidoreductase beta subunit